LLSQLLDQRRQRGRDLRQLRFPRRHVELANIALRVLAAPSAGSILREAIILINLGVRIAKDTNRIPSGLESTVSGLLIRCRLFQLSLGNSGKTLDARQFLVG